MASISYDFSARRGADASTVILPPSGLEKVAYSSHSSISLGGDGTRAPRSRSMRGGKRAP
jgi:hypothetical protein